MAIRSGIAAQLGFAQETTWGVFKVPDHFLEFENESLTQARARVESTGLRQNNRVLRTDRWAQGKIGISGDVNFEVANKGFGLLFKNLLGASSSVADGLGTHWTFTYGDPFGLGMTVQVGRPDVSGTVQPFTYTGCKPTAWEFSNAVDGILMCKTTFDGQAETTSQTLATASYPVSQELFVFTEGALTVGGVTTPVTDFSLTQTTGLKTDRYFIGAQTKSEQILDSWATPAGSFTMELTDLVAYNRFVNGTVGALTMTYTTVSTYDTAKPYKIQFSVPNVRFDGTTPNVTSPGITMLSLPYVGLNDGVNSPVSIDYWTSDSTL